MEAEDTNATNKDQNEAEVAKNTPANEETPEEENQNDDNVETIVLDSAPSSPKENGCPEIIDLDEYTNKNKKVKLDTPCINYDCQSGLDLQIASGWCLTHYRVKDEKKKQEVCRECFEEAFKFNQKLVEKLENGEYLIEVDYPVRNDLEIIDSDEETPDQELEEHKTFSDDEQQFCEENMFTQFNESLNKYNFIDQVNYGEKYLTDKLVALKVEINESIKDADELQKGFDAVRLSIYNKFKKATREIDSVDLPYDWSDNTGTAIAPRNSDNQRLEKPHREPERKSNRNVNKPVSYSEINDNDNDVELMETDPIQPSPPRACTPESDVQVISMSIMEPCNLPHRAPLQRPAPVIGEYYYAVKQSPLGVWGKSKLLDIIPRDPTNPNSETQYKVKFEHRANRQTYKTVTAKHLAYAEQCLVRLEIGTRIIAVFQTTEVNREQYFVGIIAEPLCAANNHRYLIFFDDGYAQYVCHNKVLVVVEESKKVWEDIHKDSQDFIKKYLETYPERPMVKVSRGQTFKTEHAGKWLSSVVKQIDCSLVQMQFDNDGRTEWIYRGSMRLGPMFSEMQAATNRIEKGAHIRRTFIQKKNVPYVEYTRTDPTETIVLDDDKPVAPRAVAKKSTNRPQNIPHAQNFPLKSPITGIPIPQQTGQTCSKVVYFSPKNPVDPVDFIPHTCSAQCKSFIKVNLRQLRTYSPLAKPILFGFHRLVYKYKGKKVICYKTPCGRSVRNLEECHRYLRLTESELSIDMFDFDHWVHCLAEFCVDKMLRHKRDISNGQELIPIPVVNYVDNALPDFCNYSTKREPMEGVNLNLDPEFLCGCDCEDDCLDKTKCQCWQLTIREFRTVNKKDPVDTIGYHFKRLPEFVTTGIYECNSRCKCSKSCLNRVVQHPLQLKLQLFKTSNRGWGIRCINDIPKGSFICIYAGSLLTDKMANEGGVNYGDEYLAELDYIEVVEKQKDGYESDTSDIEDRSYKSKDEEEDDEEEYEEEIVTGRTEEDDTEFVCGVSIHKDSELAVSTRSRQRQAKQQGDNTENKTDTDKEKEQDKEIDKDKEKHELENKSTTDLDDVSVTISDDEDNVREPMAFDPTAKEMDEENTKPKFVSVRKMFGDDEYCYIMDAKNTGNIGRYLNHSCSPNVFVQNVFVDTHDLRFPWVAFFAMSYIRAGTELTWNYNYDVGSVPGKVIFCQCGSPECRGRLL